jgi:hypothetical protein
VVVHNVALQRTGELWAQSPAFSGGHSLPTRVHAGNSDIHVFDSLLLASFCAFGIKNGQEKG